MIASAEQQLGRRLPQAHRERLRRANGGEIEANGEFWSLFPVWDSTDRRTVARTTNHIVRENETLRNESPDAFWDRYIAIATDGGGNLLVIGTKGDVIYGWDHETGELSPAKTSWDIPAVHAR